MEAIAAEGSPPLSWNMKLAQVDVPTPGLIVKRDTLASNSFIVGPCAFKKLTHRVQSPLCSPLPFHGSISTTYSTVVMASA